MIQLLTIIGARPQIIKAAALSRAIREQYSDKVCEKILHTGQHYDENMSQVFFNELNIPLPDFNLNVGSGAHGEQTAKMITGIEKILQSEVFDGVVVYGDTNSTLAGAVAASKLHIPLIHIEAGLRSYNMAMPEEINRIACDHLSSVLFAPTETGMNNLRNEGFFNSNAQFPNNKPRQVYHSGDIMYDNSLYFAQLSDKNQQILTKYGLENNQFILATIHRDNNTDQPERLTSIFNALLDISEANRIPVVLPLHPRTAKLLQQNLSEDLYALVADQVTNLQRTDYADTYQSMSHASKSFVMMPPASFLEMIALEKNAKIVMTDSGGVQKEAYYFEKPCIILRPETEWVEIVQQGAGMVADASYQRIMDAYEVLSKSRCSFPPIFGNGKAANYILDKICAYLEV